MVNIEELRRARTISDVLREHGIDVPDRNRYRIACPIHAGDNPNLQVDESVGLFVCYKCGCGGSVIDMLAGLEKISVGEAIKRLSDGIPEVDGNQLAAREAARVVQKLEERDIPKVEIDFSLEALEPGWRALSEETIRHFQLQRTEAGVFIPHFNLHGDLVGYVIRQNEGRQPKYLNNLHYDKAVPFGLWQNKSDIIEKGFCIIVEGQVDCMSLWNAGYRNVVALCGSSLGDSQGQTILALTTRLVLMLDADPAGIKGAAKIMRKWSAAFDVKAIFLPDGYDPSDYIQEHANDLATRGLGSNNI